MGVFLLVLTYFAYLFIIVMYTRKVIKIARMPAHLRWELYPVAYEPRSRYGSAHREDGQAWQKSHRRTMRKGISYLLSENFKFSEYFKSNLSYWLALFPWHIGFIFIIGFHVLCFFSAVAMVAGIPVTVASANLLGRIFYYAILLIGVISFIAGAFGSVGLIIKRLTDKNLKVFATPQNYFGYVFTLFVFLSGLYAWIFIDPAFTAYREFWKGLLTFNPPTVEPATAAHIILFSLFLIYLPFTRSLHYITKFFAFLWIRWDDRPNSRGSKIESNIIDSLNKPVDWSGPHITSGKTWAEIASESAIDEEKP